MIEFTKVVIKSLESYDKDLMQTIPEFLVDDDTIQKLKKYLGTRCDEINVEYPYYDGDYLSTYYIHYSQKLFPYEKVCCRLHISLKDEYYGYITLRPTVEGTKLGKTYIDASLLINETAYLALHNFKAHIAGNEMEIKSFPWKSQQTDISICAHTAMWTVIRYYGSKFKNYADTTIGNIVQRTKNDWGRKTPSLGLTPIQVSDLMKEFGFSPLILQNEKNTGNGFIDEVMSYIESGLPMVGFLYPIRHAVSIIGHGDIDYSILEDEALVKQIKDPEIDVIPHGRLVKDLYVMDDNYFPYRKMPLGLPSKESDVKYGGGELKYCVVPLYSRMQLVYNEVYSRFQAWMKENVLNWEKPCVCRIYITSSNSLKSEALKSEDMNDILKDIILKLTLPKFVWCIDLAGFDNYKKGLTSGRIIIDTTAATMDVNPWILRHDSERIEYVDIEKEKIGEYRRASSEIQYDYVECCIEPYSIYKNNLRSVQPLAYDDKEKENG